MKLEFPPGTLRPIAEADMARAATAARGSERQRSILRFHDHGEAVQRMINAVEPGSYVRPHRHVDPDKCETFVALAGRACLCRFGDDGTLEETVEFSPDGPVRGVEIPAGVWHGLVALEPGTILFEVIEGPFQEATHKRFAPWSPEEGSPAAEAFLAELRARIGAR